MSNRPKCLDFFAGSGLVTQGLETAFDVVWANDICEKKAKVFCSNHDAKVFHLGPVEQVRGRDVPAATLSWGSFPCQDLSLAGNMGGISSARSGLVWHWLRVMDEMEQRPPIVVAENVVGLISTAGGDNYRKLHDALVDRDYKVGAVVLNASHWVPQSRKRVFVIAVDGAACTRRFEACRPVWCHSSAVTRVAEGLRKWVWWNLPKPYSQRSELEDIVDFEAECYGGERAEHLLSLIPPAHRERMRSCVSRGRKVFPGYRRIRHGQQVLELRFDGLAGCLRTPQGGSSRQYLVIQKNGHAEVRLLTPEETATLMGAPKTYKLPSAYNEAYKAMGDAVAVPVVSYLSHVLLAPLARLMGSTVCERT